MKNADVTLTNMYGNVRVTFNTTAAITAANNEPEIASYLTRKDGMIYMSIQKGWENKKNVTTFCRANKLSIHDEK